MNRWFDRRHRPPAGSRPGEIVVEQEGAPPPGVHVMRYNARVVEEFDAGDLEALAEVRRPGCVVWIDVEHVSHAETLQTLGRLFGIHPLALSDVAHVPQRIKSESYDGHELIVAQMLRVLELDLDDDDEHDVRLIDVEQLSMIVGEGVVLTFQEHPGDVLEPVRRRLREGGSRIRESGPDYLAYALLDTVVDGYFPVIEHLGEQLEALDVEVLARPEGSHLERINDLKHTVLLVRRTLWPQREALNRLVRDPVAWISDDVRVYFRDTHDHCAQMVEMLESQREFAGGLLNTYLTVVSNRTNDIMRVLTIIGSIFIPLTFLAGVYGMNFDYMPELKVWWAYPTLLGVMALLALGMLVFFGRKGWLWQPRRRRARGRRRS